MRHVHLSLKLGVVAAVSVLAGGGAIAGASTHASSAHHHPPGHRYRVTSYSELPGSFFHQIANISFPSPYVNSTSFDIGYVDPTTEAYYLADRTNNGVDAVNGATGTFGSVIGSGDFSGNNTGTNVVSPAQTTACGTGTAGPNGILTLTTGGVNQLVAADGVSAAHPVSNVKIFTLTTPTSGTLSTTISTAVSANGTTGTCRADEMAYDPVDHVLVVANDLDPTPYLTFISIHSDPTLDTVIGQIKVPQATGGIEQAIYDPETHRFLVNIPGVEVMRIDPVAMQSDATYPTPNCSANGLALDEQNQEMLLGCSISPNGSEIMDARNGKVVSFFPQVSGSDEVWFDPNTNNFYLAANHMTSSGAPVPAVSTTGSGTAWSISETGATGGTFTLTVGTSTTAPIAYDATAATVATALDAVAPGTTVTGGPLPTKLSVTFTSSTSVFTANSAGLSPAGYNTPVLGIIAAGGPNRSGGEHRGWRNHDRTPTSAKPMWVENFPEPTTQGSHSVAADPVNGHVFVPLSGSGIAVFGWTSAS